VDHGDLSLKLPTARALHEWLRRTFDIIASSIILLIAAPLLAVIAITVRRESPGPAIFRQFRAGRHGPPFTLLKFRTMRINVDPYGPSPHSGEDSRLTRSGRWLREWSLDELPQFWNVLRGDMTLVGPRPLYASQAAEWNERQKLRLRVKPGLTGLAQVRGRGAITIEEKLDLDVQYVLNRSLRLDARILLETVGLLFKRQHIYEVQYSRDEHTRGEARHSPPHLSSTDDADKRNK